MFREKMAERESEVEFFIKRKLRQRWRERDGEREISLSDSRSPSNQHTLKLIHFRTLRKNQQRTYETKWEEGWSRGMGRQGGMRERNGEQDKKSQSRVGEGGMGEKDEKTP